MSTTIGTLEILKRYPVKSMRGEDLAEAQVAYTGLQGDRVWAFVDAEKGQKRDSFPWHSAREQHELLLYTPRFRRPLAPSVAYPAASDFDVEVTTPDGRRLGLTDPELLAELRRRASRDFSLRFSEKGMQDARPVSIFGLSTLDALGAETGRTLDHARFRANFYVRWTDATPFLEDSLVGKHLRIGDKCELLVSKKDPRCVIITLDPATAEPHPEVLRNVARQHKGCAGVYAVVVKEGTVRRGDAITLL